MELVPGIHLVDGVTSNTYLIVEDAGLTLVDTGMNGASKILGYIRALGRNPGELRRILLTHQHVDHVANAPALVAATGAEVYAHPLDAPAIAGKERRDAPHGPLGIVFRLVFLSRLRPVSVAHELHGGDILPVLEADGGLRVVETPGHTRGHVAFYLPGRKLLFAGDALRHSGGRMVPPPAMLNRDTPLARRSFAGLVRLEIEASLPGHGAPILQGAGKRLAETVQGLRVEE